MKDAAWKLVSGDEQQHACKLPCAAGCRNEYCLLSCRPLAGLRSTYAKIMLIMPLIAEHGSVQVSRHAFMAGVSYHYNMQQLWRARGAAQHGTPGDELSSLHDIHHAVRSCHGSGLHYRHVQYLVAIWIPHMRLQSADITNCAHKRGFHGVLPAMSLL
jgi:hypothetical protein